MKELYLSLKFKPRNVFFYITLFYILFTRLNVYNKDLKFLYLEVSALFIHMLTEKVGLKYGLKMSNKFRKK